MRESQMRSMGRGALAALLVLLVVVGMVQRSAIASPTGQASIPLAGQITYLRNGSIYLFEFSSGTDTYFEETSPLISDQSISSFAWSRDGTQLTFANSQTGNGDIFIWSGQDKSITRITDTPGIEESTPKFSPVGTLYYVRHINEGDVVTNRIMKHDPSGGNEEINSEPGGLCSVTGLSFRSETSMALSRDCGRDKNGSIIDLTTRNQIHMGRDSCVQGAVWSRDGNVLAAIEFDCSLEITNAHIAFFSPNGKRLGQIATPDNEFGLVDWSSYNNALIYGNKQGLWLIAKSGADVAKWSNEGSSPQWRPSGYDEVSEESKDPWMFPAGNSEPDVPSTPQPVLGYVGPGMPTAGQGDIVDEWLSAGALIACVAIAVGLVIISRRRRKGGDGL